MNTLIILMHLLFTPSQAGSFYLEAGVGASQLNQANGFFSESVPTDLGFGFGLNLMLGQNFMHDFSAFQIHLGAQYRVTSGANATSNYSMQSLYPVLRIEMSRFYIGAGATPLTWKRTGSNLAFDNLSQGGSLAFFGNVGLLWRMVPDFHFSLEAAVETAQTGSGLSPQFAYSGTFQFRFIVDSGRSSSSGTSGGGSRGPVKYDGWRYPFGIEL